MSVSIIIRFTDEQAAALVAHREQTLIPTNAFVRRAVEQALAAETASKPNRNPVLLVAQKASAEHEPKHQ